MTKTKLKKKNTKLPPKKKGVSFKVIAKAFKYSFASLLILGAIGTSTYYGAQVFKQFLSKPIASVAIEGDFYYLSKEALAEIINQHIKSSFIRESLNEMQQQIKTNPWVDSVVLRRQWPDQLQVSIVEQKPIAKWGDKGFVNHRGELVKVENASLIERLPTLRGKDVNAMSIMKQYQVLSQAISPYGMNIVELEENQLGIWTLQLDNEWQLLVGRSDVVKKVQQLMRILSENKISQQDQIKTIDMRYENGLAIKWKPVEQHAKQLKSTALDNSEQNI